MLSSLGRLSGDPPSEHACGSRYRLPLTPLDNIGPSVRPTRGTGLIARRRRRVKGPHFVFKHLHVPLGGQGALQTGKTDSG